MISLPPSSIGRMTASPDQNAHTDALVHPNFRRLVLQQNTASVTNIRYGLNDDFQNGWALEISFLRLGVGVVD